MGIILYNGVSTLDYGIISQVIPDYELPEKEYESTHVPGRNGDLIFGNGSYRNVNRTYYLALINENAGFVEIANSISRWLNSASGYARLEDSYEPEYYRLALYKGSANIVNLQNKVGTITVVFECKPQRYLKIGEEPIHVQSNSTIVNPTSFESNPLVFVRGYGTIIINDYVMHINENQNGLFIDSDLMDCYFEDTNMNQFVSFESGFPKLKPGDNRIEFNNTVTHVEVYPRWWTI